MLTETQRVQMLHAVGGKIGDSDTVVARGKTRSAARMTVVLNYAHTCDIDVGDVLSMVRWCRRAPWADARGHHGRTEMLTNEESAR